MVYTKAMLTLCIRGNPFTCTFANSEDPDEMQHNAAFHQGIHCLLRVKLSLDKTVFFFLNIT